MAEVAEAFGLNFDEIKGDSRFAPRPDARAVSAMILLNRGHSMAMVASRLGLKDHTTVHHYKSTWAKRCKKRPIVAEVYARFVAERLAA